MKNTEAQTVYIGKFIKKIITIKTYRTDCKSCMKNIPFKEKLHRTQYFKLILFVLKKKEFHDFKAVYFIFMRFCYVKCYMEDK